MLLSNLDTTAPPTPNKSNPIHTDLYNINIFTFLPLSKPTTSRLRALDAAAERAAPLEGVGVAVQSAVLNACQLCAAYVR
jgi:hypothetical protein